MREEAVRGELQQRLAEAQEERAELGRRLEEEGEIHSLQRSETEAHIKHSIHLALKPTSVDDLLL